MTDQSRSDDRRAGGGTVTRDEFYLYFDQLKDELANGHRRLREDMNAGMGRIERQNEALQMTASDVSRRLLTIEVERKIERAQAKRHGAIIGGVFGIIGSGIVAGILRLLKI